MLRSPYLWVLVPCARTGARKDSGISMRPIMGAAAALAMLVASSASAQESEATGPRVPLVAGVTLISAGAAAAAGGAIAYTWLGTQTPSCEACTDPYRIEKGASVVGILLGTASIAVGIPFVLLDDGEAPAGKPRSAPLAPELRVGPGGASLSVSF
jgi:hypothetical protein